MYILNQNTDFEKFIEIQATQFSEQRERQNPRKGQRVSEKLLDAHVSSSARAYMVAARKKSPKGFTSFVKLLSEHGNRSARLPWKKGSAAGLLLQQSPSLFPPFQNCMP